MDPAFIKINRPFVLSFGNRNDWKYFSKYYPRNVEVKDLNLLIQRGNVKTKTVLEIIVPLNHLNNFRRILNMHLINFQASLTLTWSQTCLLTDITRQVTRAAQGDNRQKAAINALKNATFKIQDTEFYVSVKIGSIENDKKAIGTSKNRI